MGFLDKIKGMLHKKKEEDTMEMFPSPYQDSASFPADLERFKTPSEPVESTPSSMEQKIDIEPFAKPPAFEPIKNEIPEEREVDRIDLIITKLDAIDSRLKLIEERLRK